MITDNLDNIEVCRLGFWWAVGGVVGPAMLLWQEIWSISCRVSPSYSISTTTNNHQLGSGPDHLSLGNKEGDNSQWEAFYLNSAASRLAEFLHSDFLQQFLTPRAYLEEMTANLHGLTGIFIIWLVYTDQAWPASVTDQASPSLSCSAPDRKREKPIRATWAVSSAVRTWAIISSGGGSY